MANTGKHLSRLFLAANATALVAVVCHVPGVAVPSGRLAMPGNRRRTDVRRECGWPYRFRRSSICSNLCALQIGFSAPS